MKKFIIFISIAFFILLPLTLCSGNKTDSYETALTPETEKHEEKISFLAAGDNIIHSAVYTDAKAENGYDFSKMYSHVKNIISSADIAFVNQETVCSGKAVSGYPLFCTPDEIADDLVKVGFDVINIASNHMLDGDIDGDGSGLCHAINLWQKKDVLMTGGYLSEADSQIPRKIRKGNIEISFLSYTYGTNIEAGENFPLYIPYINEEKMERDIKNAADVSDFVVVSVHWGEENSKEPTTEQRQLAKKMAEWGADAIIGHHSHTLQSVETIEARGKKTIVAYSLGNFLSAQTKVQNLVGGIFGFDIVKDEKGTRWENVSLTPTVCHYGFPSSDDISTRGNITIYPLYQYTKELCAVHGANAYGKVTLDMLYGCASAFTLDNQAYSK